MAKAKRLATTKERVSGGYPYDGLARCIKLGGIIRDHGGKDVSKAELANALGLAESAAVLYQVVASAKCFGIIEGSRDLSLTEGGRDYFSPHTESAARIAELGFFGTPRVFKSTIERFDGSKLPATNILSNLMHRQFGVPESWATRTAGLFTSSAIELNIIDANGILRYGVGLQRAGREPQRMDGPVTPPELERVVPRPANISGTSIGSAVAYGVATASAAPASAETVWVHREIRLHTPDNMTKALWDQLNRYVQSLKPTDDNQPAAQAAGSTNGGG
jgi:hypothetical protein